MNDHDKRFARLAVKSGLTTEAAIRDVGLNCRKQGITYKNNLPELLLRFRSLTSEQCEALVPIPERSGNPE